MKLRLACWNTVLAKIFCYFHAKLACPPTNLLEVLDRVTPEIAYQEAHYCPRSARSSQNRSNFLNFVQVQFCRRELVRVKGGPVSLAFDRHRPNLAAAPTGINIIGRAEGCALPAIDSSPANPHSRSNHVRPAVQRGFDGCASFRAGLTCSGSKLVMPVICLYFSAEMITILSPFLRRTSTGSCWTSLSSAPKRLRAAVTVRDFTCFLSAEINES